MVTHRVWYLDDSCLNLFFFCFLSGLSSGGVLKSVIPFPFLGLLSTIRTIHLTVWTLGFLLCTTVICPMLPLSQVWLVGAPRADPSV